MSSKFCSEEQFLTIKKINRDQSRIIDSKQAIIEDQARLINTQQQLIDMMYENIKTLKGEINKLQSEVEDDESSSQYQRRNHYHNRYHNQRRYRQNTSHGSEHSIENVSSNDFEHEDRYGNNGDSEHNGYRVLLENIKNSIPLKMVKNQLERTYGPIYDIEQDKQDKSLAYAYFENRQHFSKALEDGRIRVDAVNYPRGCGIQKARNATVISGTDETYTDTLVADLLRIVGLDTFPSAIRNHQECRLFIGGYPYLTADPEFSINMIDTSMIAVEDKHLQTIGLSKSYREWQIVAEILACSDENMR
ncbi:unnamed protein product [Rhizophagus irregularis]|nr:unnamed protein product [Rhizophagus irregularis]